MAEAVGIAVLVVGLLISIALHEVGHMVPAKKFGVRVSQYFVGFGPTLWSRQGKETEYGLKAIPLGGYVRLVGMIPPADQVKPLKSTGKAATLIEDSRAVAVEEMHEGEDHRAFYRLAWWKKVIVMAGGPLVNLVLAALLFTIVLSGIGVAAATLTVRDTVPCVPAEVGAECTDADPASPAAQAGLQSGDTFTAVDGTAVATWGELTSYVADRPGTPVDLTVTRDGEEQNLTLTPLATERTVIADADGNPVEPYTETVGFMGVSAEIELQRQPLAMGTQVTGEYLGLMTEVVATLPVHLYEVSRAALGLEERDPNGVVGLVGIGRIAAESSGAEAEGFGFTEKLAEMLLLLGGLNLALFVFNMVPLVPLDGGHIASALWQAVKNGWARMRGAAKPFAVDVARQMPLAYGVFGILILMAIVLVYADIVAPVTRA